MTKFGVWVGSKISGSLIIVYNPGEWHISKSDLAGWDRCRRIDFYYIESADTGEVLCNDIPFRILCDFLLQRDAGNFTQYGIMPRQQAADPVAAESSPESPDPQ